MMIRSSFPKNLQKMRHRKRKLEKRFKRTHEPPDLQSFKNFLKLYNRRLRKLKPSFFSKMLAELETNPKEFHKTINSLLNRSKKMVSPNAADASELFSAYFVDEILKIHSDIKPPETHSSTPMPRASLLSNFQPVLKSAVWSLVKSSQRSVSPADPIPVPLLCTIIDSIFPVITLL